VPADQGGRLDDQQRLLPVSQPTSQRYQQHSPSRAGQGALHLAVQDDQLLAEEGILKNEFFPGAGEVCHDVGGQRIVVWFDQAAQSLFDRVQGVGKRGGEWREITDALFGLNSGLRFYLTTC
jgi:hypothetical protein